MVIRKLRYTAWVCFLVALAATALGCTPDRQTSATTTPNIVLVIGDDHAWPNYGFMGDPIVQTPHIDALAQRGFVFPYGFAHGSTCRPALMALLTGLNTDQWEWKNEDLRKKRIMQLDHVLELRQIEFYRTLPRELAKVGYASFQGGKHWEGLYHEAGFTAGTKVARAKHMLDWSGHSGDPAFFGRESIQSAFDFVDSLDHQPFFMWFAPKLPHHPHDAGAEFLELYRGKGLSDSTLAYYANISRFDARVGELTEYLASKGYLENTLIILLSDNGWQLMPLDDEAAEQPFKGGAKGKGSAYEMGYRTPIVVSYPGHVPPGRNEALVTGIDVFATILDYATAPPLSDRVGISLRPLLEGRDVSVRTHVVEKSFMTENPDPHEVAAGGGTVPPRPTTRFVRTKEWRYLRDQQNGHEELYRIDSDPFENTDVLADNRDVAAQLRSYLDQWLTRMRLPDGEYDLDGVVRGMTTGEPLEGVELVLSGVGVDGTKLEFDALSNPDGSFQFYDIPAGEFTVTSRTGDRRFVDLANDSARVRVSLPQGTLGGFIAIGAESVTR